jgi:hypothetical protein
LFAVCSAPVIRESFPIATVLDVVPVGRYVIATFPVLSRGQNIDHEKAGPESPKTARISTTTAIAFFCIKLRLSISTKFRPAQVAK